jgi:acyl-CoA hydrolase/GNAT superfamily N-acetyltransferase
MSSWQEKYASKIFDSATAVKKIQPGSRVVIGSAAGEPRELARALAAQAGMLDDIELITMYNLGDTPYAKANMAGTFRCNTLLIGNESMEMAVNQARADYTPVSLSSVPKLFTAGRWPVDVAVIMVSEPDEHGYVSLGVSVDVTLAAVEAAKIVIAQVNKNMPRTGGNSLIKVDKIDALVSFDEDLPEIGGWDGNPAIANAIAAYVSPMVSDGSTVQFGTGGLPDAIAATLTDKKDLGVHSGFISDGVMKLIQAGVVTGKNKSIDKGQVVASFCVGSKELYKFINNNPEIVLKSSDYTSDLRVVAKQDHMVCINQATQIDLTGQVVSDSVGTKFTSGIAGQADFIRGANYSASGKSFIVMPSTMKNEDGQTVSSIVSELEPGTGVRTPRSDVNYVITEYGVAYLHGLSMRQRAMALINIAHPNFRSELLHAAKHRHLVYPNQILPAVTPPPPASLTTKYESPDRRRVMVRPIRPDDEPFIRDMFYSFSEQTVYLRFHHAIKALPHDKLQGFCNVDFQNEVALVGVAGPIEALQIVAIGRYFIQKDGTEADLAFIVRDDFQRQGLGSYLFEQLVDVAKSRGIKKFTADVLSENAGMLKIFKRSNLNVVTENEEGVVHVTMTVPE